MLNFAVEVYVLVDVVFLRNVLPVCADFSARSEFFGPLRVGCESALICMCWNITSDAGVDVLQPGSSYVGVLFVYFEVDARDFRGSMLSLASREILYVLTKELTAIFRH